MNNRAHNANNTGGLSFNGIYVNWGGTVADARETLNYRGDLRIGEMTIALNGINWISRARIIVEVIIKIEGVRREYVLLQKSIMA